MRRQMESDPGAALQLITALSQQIAGGGRLPLLARRLLMALQPWAAAVEIGIRWHHEDEVAEGYRVDPWSTKAIERLTDAPLWSQSQMERRPITRRVDHDHLGPALYPWSPAPMAGLMLCATLDLVGFNDGYVTLHLSPTVEGSPLLQPDCLEAALQIITGALIATRRERKIAARCRLAHKKIMAQAQRISAVATPWGLEGQGEAITDLRSQAATFADADVPILITGPAGAGRWALATHLHQISGFCQRPLTRLRCAALHDSGRLRALLGPDGPLAQPGAVVVLDGVDALPEPAQRALADRLGDDLRDRPRLVAIARSLSELAPELAYRLAGVHLQMPALVDRREDLPELVEGWLARWAARRGRPQPEVPADVLAQLARHRWPGGLPELEGALTRALLVGHGGRLGLPMLGPPPPGPARSFEEAVVACIVEALKATNGSIYGADGAAARLGLNPSTLQSKMRKYGIRRGLYAD